MKKYYLYRRPILKDSKNGDWFYDDQFDSYEDAFNQAKINCEKGSWKVWKIEEVLVFNPF